VSFHFHAGRFRRRVLGRTTWRISCLHARPATARRSIDFSRPPRLGDCLPSPQPCSQPLRMRCPTSRCSGRSRRREIGVTSTNRSCGGLAAERQIVRQTGPQLGAFGVLVAKTIVSRSQLDCFPPKIFAVVVTASRILSRLRRPPIAGISPKELRLRRGNCRAPGCALAPTCVASAPTSPLGRLLSRSRFLGNALAGARTPDLRNHRRILTYSFSISAKNISACGCVFAARASQV